MNTKINPRNLSRSVFAAATFCSIILSSVASAQLMGTKNIPGDYATLAAAITDLNTQGVGAGGVTLNLLAANPETAPAGGYVIGDTGSLVLTTTASSSPVIIQGNANIITASGAQTVGDSERRHFQIDRRGLGHHHRFYHAGKRCEYRDRSRDQQHDGMGRGFALCHDNGRLRRTTRFQITRSLLTEPTRIPSASTATRPTARPQ